MRDFNLRIEHELLFLGVELDTEKGVLWRFYGCYEGFALVVLAQSCCLEG